jgi:methylmalonyl-CoA/ethylmalonyl-CoA epimerase
MSGRFGSLRLCYLDTFEALGVYLELIEDPDEILWTTCPWRDRPS